MAADDSATDRRGTDSNQHVCVFCGEKFDVADRASCPSCDATVVVRGQR